jgi:putative Mn2+ efflux pump MntP
MFKFLEKLTKSEKIWLCFVVLYFIGMICLNFSLSKADDLYSNQSEKEVDL